MAYFRCSGGSGELHGASIVVTCDDDASIGVTCTLKFGDEVIGTQTFTDTKTLVFKNILGVGTYTASIMLDKEFRGEILVTAEDIVNKNNVDGLITTRFFLYNEGDECVDITNGWDMVGSGNNYCEKQANRIKVYYGHIGTKKLIDVTNYTKLKCLVEQTETNTKGCRIFASTSTTETTGPSYWTNTVGIVEYTIDISDMTSMCVIAYHGNSSNPAVYITKAWLE